MRRFLAVAVIVSTALFAGCATQIKPSKTTNALPLEKFSAFDRFELKPIELAAEYAEHGANTKATAKIQEYFDLRVKTIVGAWNNKSGRNARTLVIEPRIEQIKFIGGGARFFAGALAGSSAVLMKVKYVDKKTGKVIAEPEFYQRASAYSGAASFGGEDNAMLARISTLVANYTKRNYEQRVGGETGGNGLISDAELASN